MTHPDLFLERQERGTARVARDPFESKMVALLMDYGRMQVVFTSDELGDVLDRMGVARVGLDACNLRKRLIATAIARGKANGLWTHTGYAVSKRHGGPRSRWKVA
jgi:hypothetical protein